jgi:hypothetical protein
LAISKLLPLYLRIAAYKQAESWAPPNLDIYYNVRETMCFFFLLLPSHLTFASCLKFMRGVVVDNAIHIKNMTKVDVILFQAFL